MVLTTLLKIQTVLPLSENFDLILESGDFYDTGLCCFAKSLERSTSNKKWSSLPNFQKPKEANVHFRHLPINGFEIVPPTRADIQVHLPINGFEPVPPTRADIQVNLPINPFEIVPTETKCDDMNYFDDPDIHAEMMDDGGEPLLDPTTNEGFWAKKKKWFLSRSKSSKPKEAKVPQSTTSKRLTWNGKGLSDSKSKRRLTAADIKVDWTDDLAKQNRPTKADIGVYVIPGHFEEPETLTLYKNSRDGWWKRFKHGLAKFDDPNKDRNESLASLLNLINPNPKEGSFGRWIRLFKIGRYSSFLRRNKEARNLLSQALSQGRLREYLRVLQNSKDLSRLVGTLKDNQGNEFSIPASFLTILAVSSSGATEENREIAMEILQKLKKINPAVVSKKITVKQLKREGTQEVDLLTFARYVLNVNKMNPARDALIANLEDWSASPVAPPKSLVERLKFWKR